MTTTGENLADAFLTDFRSMSTIGATADGGLDRQAGTATDGQVRNWFRGLTEGHGFRVRYDQVGNQFALLELVPGAPYIAVGSHLDSQPLGGRFDGAYGVLAAAQAAFRLKHRNAPSDFNIAVVNWFNEEGSRFKPSMMGSSVFTGKIPLDNALATTDSTGTTVKEALDDNDTRENFSLEIAGYMEIHIEQGRHLEDSGLSIGIVDSTWAARKYEFTVHGEQAHTGATDIADRQDALFGASSLVVAAREIADAHSDDENMVITSCGELNVFPNSPVVVASRVGLLMDIRSSDPDKLAAADAQLHRRIAEIEQYANVRIEGGAEHVWGSNAYDPEGLELATAVTQSLGFPYGMVRTRAGHDSTNLKDHVPTIMLFVPSVDGISHNERELTYDDDMLAGVDLLTELLARTLIGDFVKPRNTPTAPLKTNENFL